MADAIIRAQKESHMVSNVYDTAESSDAVVNPFQYALEKAIVHGGIQFQEQSSKTPSASGSSSVAFDVPRVGYALAGSYIRNTYNVAVVTANADINPSVADGTVEDNKMGLLDAIESISVKSRRTELMKIDKWGILAALRDMPQEKRELYNLLVKQGVKASDGFTTSAQEVAAGSNVDVYQYIPLDLICSFFSGDVRQSIYLGLAEQLQIVVKFDAMSNTQTDTIKWADTTNTTVTVTESLLSTNHYQLEAEEEKRLFAEMAQSAESKYIAYEYVSSSNSGVLAVAGGNSIRMENFKLITDLYAFNYDATNEELAYVKSVSVKSGNKVIAGPMNPSESALQMLSNMNQFKDSYVLKVPFAVGSDNNSTSSFKGVLAVDNLIDPRCNITGSQTTSPDTVELVARGIIGLKMNHSTGALTLTSSS